MRRLAIFIILILTLSIFVPVVLYAQDDENTVTTEELVQRAEAAAAQAEQSALQAAESRLISEETAGRADSAADLAFNLLGLFEAFSFIITVVGVALSALGFQRLLSAQSELIKARDEVNAQLDESRKKFDEEFTKQRLQLADLQTSLEEGAEKRRIITERALLAQAYIPLGERQYKAQDYTGAITTYQQALDLDPKNPVIHYRLGYVYTQKGDLDDAKKHYEQAMSLADNFAPAMAGLGFVYRRIAEKMPDNIDRKQLMNDAEELLLKAMNLSPKLVDDDGESWWGILGGLYRRRGQVDDAIYAYKQATIVTPQSSYGFGNLALLYMLKNMRNEMLETFGEVEKLASAESGADVNNYWGHADLVVSRYALGKFDEAQPVLDRTIQIAPLESPFMLEGLQGTLEDLSKVVEESKAPAILEAVDRIQKEREKRDKILADRRAQDEADRAARELMLQKEAEPESEPTA